MGRVLVKAAAGGQVAQGIQSLLAPAKTTFGQGLGGESQADIFQGAGGAALGAQSANIAAGKLGDAVADGTKNLKTTYDTRAPSGKYSRAKDTFANDKKDAESAMQNALQSNQNAIRTEREDNKFSRDGIEHWDTGRRLGSDNAREYGIGDGTLGYVGNKDEGGFGDGTYQEALDRKYNDERRQDMFGPDFVPDAFNNWNARVNPNLQPNSIPMNDFVNDIGYNHELANVNYPPISQDGFSSYVPPSPYNVPNQNQNEINGNGSMADNGTADLSITGPNTETSNFDPNNAESKAQFENLFAKKSIPMELAFRLLKSVMS